MIADGAYDGASVYRAAFLCRHDLPPDIIIPLLASSVINDDNAAASTARNRHVHYIAEKGRMAWQKASGYGRRSFVEIAIGRYKHIIGPKLRARSSDGQRSKTAIAVQVLNRMGRFPKPISTHRA